MNIELIPNYPLNGGEDSANSTRDCKASIAKEVMKPSSIISSDLAEITSENILLPNKDYLKNYMTKESPGSQRKSHQYSCTLCHYTTKYMAVCLSHIEICLKKLAVEELNESVVDELSSDEVNNESEKVVNNSHLNVPEKEHRGNMYWNYKCNEFLLDSLFAIATVFEKFGDGLGMSYSIRQN